MLDNLIEHQPHGPDGADGLGLAGIRKQGQIPDDGAIDPHLHEDIGIHSAVVGQRTPDIADGHSIDTAREGLIQSLAVQGIGVDRRGLRGGLLRGWSFGRGGLGGLRGSSGGLGGGRGGCTAAAAQQQAQSQQ